MDSENHHDFESEEEFWHELDELLAKPCDTHVLLDDTLRSYLTLATTFPDYVQTDHDVRRCAFRLYSSLLFTEHASYIRTQFVHLLLQEDEPATLHVASTFILADAREHEQTFELMKAEGGFPRLVDLISRPKSNQDESLHRQLMELLYELARIQKITNDDLACIDDGFVFYLFNIIEQVSDDVEDPYHYPIIRVLLVLNEQFMVAAHDPSAEPQKNAPLTNKVMKVLSAHGSKYKTFGENIILLLNREDETSLQLLTLKLLYLLFTTPPTYEYFYTNDLYVLVDILIRNLLDLPEEALALRHTYLRVMYPLLEHTQLKDPPHYKRDEVRKLLSVLVGGHLAHFEGPGSSISYFEEVDETTRRLVSRCQSVSWLKSHETEVNIEPPVDTEDAVQASPSRSVPPALPAPRKLRKRSDSRTSGSGPGFLTPQLESARQSSLSMAEMAVQKEKPGVITPSRSSAAKSGLLASVIQKKEKPPPPRARRSGLGRFKSHPPPTPEPEREHETEHEPGESPISADAEVTLINTNQNPPSAGEKQNFEQVTSDGEAEAEESSKSTKKPPPPAPKQRRWRLKRTKEEVKSDEPTAMQDATISKIGTSSNPPRLSIPYLETDDQTAEAKAFHLSPFSPPEEKTLSPFVPHAASDNEISNATTYSSLDAQLSPQNTNPPSSLSSFSTATKDGIQTSKKAKRISSVSAALGHAQAQALQDLGQSLEKATIHEHVSEHNLGLARGTDHVQGHETQTATTSRHGRDAGTAGTDRRRTEILAPPGQAPVRSVPGPTVEIDRDDKSSSWYHQPHRSAHHRQYHPTHEHEYGYEYEGDGNPTQITRLRTHETIHEEDEHKVEHEHEHHHDRDQNSTTQQRVENEKEKEKEEEEESSEDEWN